jgi:hypothetical protein
MLKRQTVETLINEEALLFAKYLRKEERMDIKNRNLHGIKSVCLKGIKQNLRKLE